MAAWQEKYRKPVVVDECGYEGDIHLGWGDLSAEELLMRFWRGFTLGGYVGHGETYVNEQEELWWSKGGQLKGQSAPRIAFLRKIFEQTPELRAVKKPDPEEIDLMDPAAQQAALSPGGVKNLESLMAQEAWGADAVGIDAHGETCLFYFGMRQPGGRRFDLPTHQSYRIDVIDTWNMTLDTAAEAACGETWVKLPGKKFIALRIQRNP